MNNISASSSARANLGSPLTAEKLAHVDPTISRDNTSGIKEQERTLLATLGQSLGQKDLSNESALVEEEMAFDTQRGFKEQARTLFATIRQSLDQKALSDESALRQRLGQKALSNESALVEEEMAFDTQRVSQDQLLQREQELSTEVSGLDYDKLREYRQQESNPRNYTLEASQSVGAETQLPPPPPAPRYWAMQNAQENPRQQRKTQTPLRQKDRASTFLQSEPDQVTRPQTLANRSISSPINVKLDQDDMRASTCTSMQELPSGPFGNEADHAYDTQRSFGLSLMNESSTTREDHVDREICLKPSSSSALPQLLGQFGSVQYPSLSIDLVSEEALTAHGIPFVNDPVSRAT